MTAAISPARALAVTVLARVWEGGAFATAALDAELSRAALDPRDAALATELVYGVLRAEGWLDQRIASLSKPAWSKGTRVRAHVLIAAYSMAFLDRVPAFAAVSEAVMGARADGGDRVAGFANAVLRRLASELEADAKRPLLTDAIVASAPGFLRGALRRSLGRSAASAYLAAGPTPPPIGLCLARGEDRDAWMATLQKAAPNATIAPGAISPRAILVGGAGDVRKLPGAGAAWIVQEEGAQAITLAAGAKPGDRVLDACAGHGNKTWLLADEVGPEGAVDASDLHPQKLLDLREGPPGKRVRGVFAVDWTGDTSAVPKDYDVVIVDAPCSGIGTLRRRPEIALRRDAADVERLAALQTTIALHAAKHVRDGGRLVFAVCSVLREEGEGVIEKLLSGEPALEPAPLASVGAGASSLRLLPNVHGTDGYFVASFLVRRPRT